MRARWVLAVIAALIAAVSVLSWRLGYRAASDKHAAAAVTDTLVVRDTVTVETPIPVLTTVIDTILVMCPDIIVVRDTVYARLLKERKKYSGSDYRAVVSGYRPSLDLIQVFPETRVVTKTVTVRQGKRRWSVGAQAGYGLTLRDGQAVLSPYVGVGVSYNLMDW